MEPLLTRAELERETRKIWEEAFTVDEIHTMEVTSTVLGAEVFVWGNLDVRQLRALRRGLFSTALSGRGV